MHPAPKALRPWQSSNPGKRAAETFWLCYTPVWGLVAGVVMVGGWAEHWGDGALLVLGSVLGAGAFLGPQLFPAPEERALPWRARASFKLSVAVVGFAFGMNYSMTPFFYDVLHMHYGFPTHWNLRANPIFLYLITVAYFATYCALMNGLWRVVRARVAHRGQGWRWGATALVPLAVAALETALNANPFMTRLFCYDDMLLMMTFGTVCYGTSLGLALPVWIGVDERPGERVPLGRVVLWVAAAMYAVVLVFDGYRYVVAPHLTTVVEGAPGLRDYEGSCLEAPLAVSDRSAAE